MKKISENKIKKFKLIGLFIYVLIACLIVYLTKPVYIFSIFIVLVPPAIINFLWLKKSRKKILIFSIVSTFLFAFAIELSSRLANTWDVQSILPRLFGLIPLENMLFAFLNIFWVLCFYEYFVDKDKTIKISKKFKYLVALFCLFSLIIFSIYFYDSNKIAMNYFTTAIIVLIIPAIIIFSKKPKLLKKIILPLIFFAIVFFIYELISLKIGSWWWPGEYLLPIKMFGKVLPLDDIIIWYFLSTITLIGGYEFFADDWK
jgi:hypothetical protein